MKNLIYSMLLILALVLPNNLFADDVNLALPMRARVITGDDATNSWWTAAKAADGEESTYWSSCNGDSESQWTKHWIIVDLGNVFEINKLDVMWGNTANIYALCLSTASNVEELVRTEAAKETPNPFNIGERVGYKNYHDDGKTAVTGESHEYVLDQTTKARYVVILTWKDFVADTGYGVSIKELQIWGKEAAHDLSATGYASFSARYNVMVPEGVTVYKAAVEGDKVKLTDTETNIIPANTGVILKGEQQNYYFEATYRDDVSGDFTANELIATSTSGNEVVPATGSYYALNASAVEFDALTNGMTLSSNKAYLPAEVSGAKKIYVVFDGETTNINNVNTNIKHDGKYISNGRIVIEKNGRKFNVAGQLLK